MSPLPPLPPGTELADAGAASSLPPLPPGTELAEEARALPPLPPGTEIEDNPVRSALLAQRDLRGSLAAQGVDEIARVGLAAQGAIPETQAPWITVPVAQTIFPTDERRREVLTHPFDALGFAASNLPREAGKAWAGVVAPVMVPLAGQTVSTLTLGKIDPAYASDVANAYVRGVAEVPADMVQAVYGDPAMFALTMGGMLAPGVSAIAPFVHAAPTAYFAAEGVAGMAPSTFGRTAEQREQASPVALLAPERWAMLDPEQKIETWRGALGSLLMMAGPVAHTAKGLADAKGLPRVAEEGARVLPDKVKDSAFREAAGDAMESMLNERPFETVDQIRAWITSPTFMLDALERAAPATRFQDVVVQTGKGLFLDRVPVEEGKSSLTRKSFIYENGLAEAARARELEGELWASGRPTWMFPAKVMLDVPFGTEEGAYAILKKQTEGTGITDAQFNANALVWKRFSNVWQNVMDLDVGHFWGILANSKGDLRTNGDALLQMIGEEGAKRLDASGRYPQVLGLRLMDAESLEKAGRPMPEIRKLTGWERGAEGKWQVEISDKAIKVDAKPEDLVSMRSVPLNAKGMHKTVADLGPMPRLLTAYPDLARVLVALDDNPPALSGSIAHYDVANNALVFTKNAWNPLRTNGETFKQVVMHEIQHWIQEKEGFARGGNPNSVFDAMPERTKRKVVQDRLAEIENDAHLNEMYRDLTERILDRSSAFEAYKAETNPAKKMALRNALLDDMGMMGAKGRALRARAMELLEQNDLEGLENIYASAMIESPRLEQLKNKLGAVVQMDDMGWARDIFKDDGYLQTLYERLAGEVQARGTAARAGMSQAEIDVSPRVPDRPRKEQIVRVPGGLFQSEAGTIKGQATPLADGRMLVELFEKADVSTLVHESSHVFRRALYAMGNMAREEVKPNLLEGLTRLEKWAGVKDGKWDVPSEERWARGVEQYLRTGKAPSPGLQGLMSQFKGWFRSIYDDASAAQLATFSPEVEKFFETYVLAEPHGRQGERAWQIMERMKAEDRDAYEAAVAIRDLPKAKAKLTERIAAFQNLIDLTRKDQIESGPADALKKKAAVRLLIREVRKTNGETLLDAAAEREAVIAQSERYFANPNLLMDLVEKSLVPRLEQLSKAILVAEATYKARVDVIAMRGNVGDAWGKNPIEDAAKVELLEQLRQDVSAAREALRGVDGMEAIMSGQALDPAAVIRDLTAGIRESLQLERFTEAEALSMVEKQAARFMEGALDATAEAARDRFKTPWGRVVEGFKPLLLGLRSFGREVFDPMSALEPYTYDPGRGINKLLRLLGMAEEKPFKLGDAEMTALKKTFSEMDGELNYWDKSISPFWMKAIHEAFPRLADRQFMTMVRDSGKLDFTELESRMKRRAEDAVTARNAIDRKKDPDAWRDAANRAAIAAKQYERAKGHVGINGAGPSPGMSYVLSQVAGAFDALQNIGVRAGLWEPEAFRENYLPRIYRKEDVAAAVKFYRENAELGGPNRHGFHRVFETMAEAYVIAGLRPATLDMAFLVDQYGRSLTESIQKRRLVTQLRQIAPDLFEAVDKGRSAPSPHFMDISPFVSHAIMPADLTNPAARLYAHRSIGTLLENLSKQSAWDKNVVGQSAKAVNTYLKRIQLAIDLYHLWQVTRVAEASGVYGPAQHMALPFWSYAKALGTLDPNSPGHPLVKEMIQHGLDTSSGDWARREIYKGVEDQIIGKISPGAKAWHWFGEEFETMSRYMWERYVPALKILTATRHLERLMENPRTQHMSREVLLKAAATVANDKFGSSVQSLKGRSKTLNDTMSIAFLAPQWLESRFRNVLGGFKKGPEGALWRDYWLGEGVMDVARGGNPLEVTPKKWATGYVVQGMILCALGNAMVAGLWPEGAEKEKAKAERGINWFTATVIPAQDKRGFPLKVSPFATMDYFTAFVSDLFSVAPALRWYRGRQGPLLRAGTELFLGTDYAGRPQRPGFFSPETLGQLVDSALPWFHNIVYGSVGEVAYGDDPGFGLWRSAARLTGGHTTSSWLPGVQDKVEFFKSQSQQWNRQSSKEWAKWYYTAPGVGDVMLVAARAKANRHNALLNEFIEEVKHDPRMQATLGKTMDQLGRYYMVVPPARR